MTMKNATATTVGASRPRRFGVRFWLSLDAVLWILLGVLAIVAPLIAGLATVALFAVLLIAAGVVGLVGLFRSGRRGAWGWRLVSTIAAFVAGVLLLLDLFLGAWTITLLVAAYLIASGVTAAVAAFRMRRVEARGWYWLLVAAAVDIALAALSLLIAPIAAPIFLGYLLGVDLVLSGAGLLAFARSRSVAAWDQVAPRT